MLHTLRVSPGDTVCTFETAEGDYTPAVRLERKIGSPLVIDELVKGIIYNLRCHIAVAHA